MASIEELKSALRRQQEAAQQTEPLVNEVLERLFARRRMCNIILQGTSAEQYIRITNAQRDTEQLLHEVRRKIQEEIEAFAAAIVRLG